MIVGQMILVVVMTCVWSANALVMATLRGPRCAVHGEILPALRAYRNEAERDEQFRLQQEMLARRRNPKAKAAEEEKVNKRREQAQAGVMETMWAKKTPANVDPLIEWKKAKDQGKLRDLGYEETANNPDLRVSLPIPLSPIDLPAYDNGLRFDLRLPYAETGYEDESADVLGNMGKALGNLFGKKEKEAKETKEAKEEPPSPPPKKKGPFGW